MSKLFRILTLCLILGALLLASACGEAEISPDESTAATNTPQPSSPDGDSAYPGPAGEDAYPGPGTSDGYPGADEAIEGLSADPPNPERNLPEAGGDTAVIGGALIREVTDQGFVPLDPSQFVLAEVVQSDSGEASLLRYNEQSLRAETFPTGIFIFADVPPGTYGLVVNIGVTEFPIVQEDGSELTVTVEAGEALDLGQLFVEIP